jgi:hypothetical protein
MLATHLQIAVFYIGLNVLIALGLALMVVSNRVRTKTSVGDGGDSKLQAAIRAHANNSEYVPFALILLIGLALVNASTILLHVMGIALTLGRLLHGLGLNQNIDSPLRPAGALTTWLTFLVGSIACIYYAL